MSIRNVMQPAVGTLLAIMVLWCTPVFSAQMWIQQGPLSRALSSAVFDPTTSEMIVFGGLTVSGPANDVWQSTLSASSKPDLTWTQPSIKGLVPSARYGHGVVYDSNQKVMTLFGGNSGSGCLSDTWTLSGANGSSPAWSQVASSGPSARQGPAAAYDSGSRTMMLFGGSDCNGGFLNDIWVLRAGVWTELAPGGPLPEAREGSTAVYDSEHNTLILFGGDNGVQFFGDVWTLSNANGTGGKPVWTMLTISGDVPAARSGHGAVYSSSGTMYVFGGTSTSNPATGALNDTWTLTGVFSESPVWTELVVAGQPLPRAYGTLVLRQSTNEIFAFGGYVSVNETSYLDDHIFVLSLNSPPTWTHKGIRSRYGHTAVFDPSTQRKIVFGGQHTKTYGNLNDTFTGTETPGSANLVWTGESPSGPLPPARWGHVAAYNPASNVMTVFGGGTGLTSYGPCLNDLWLLLNANNTQQPKWSEAVVPSPPPARAGHGAGYNSSTNTLIVFGGTDCNGGYLNDVWVLSNPDGAGPMVWTQLHPAGSPPAARENAGVAYDLTQNELIVFGGDSGETKYNDLWILTNANGQAGTPAWLMLRPSGTPPPVLTKPAVVYESSTDNLLVCTGLGVTEAVGGCWEVSGASEKSTQVWSQLVTTGIQVPARYGATTFVGGENIVLFGGHLNDGEGFSPSDDHSYMLVRQNDEERSWLFGYSATECVVSGN